MFPLKAPKLHNKDILDGCVGLPVPSHYFSSADNFSERAERGGGGGGQGFLTMVFFDGLVQSVRLCATVKTGSVPRVLHRRPAPVMKSVCRLSAPLCQHPTW